MDPRALPVMIFGQHLTMNEGGSLENSEGWFKIPRERTKRKTERGYG